MSVPSVDLESSRGAVARLVEKYINLRGTSKTQLAIRLGVDSSKLRWLVNGRGDKSVRYLGLRTIGDAQAPFLRRLADDLEIPDDELMQAVAFDLGIVRAVSPTIVPSRLSLSVRAIPFEHPARRAHLRLVHSKIA